MLATNTRTTSRFKAPDAGDLRAALQRSLGSNFDGIWSECCGQIGLDPASAVMSDEELDRLVTAVAAYNPICRVVAMSWRIRRTAAHKMGDLGR